MVRMSIPAVPVPSHADARAAAPASVPAALPQWPSEVLLQGGREAVIAHQGAHYRLRVTASGKLILTK